MKTNELPKPPRQKTSVVIEGLDTSTPDDLVKDGKCETLHNLRYKEGAWRPVHPHKVNHRLNDELSAELEIVYHHPAAGEDTYIAYYKEEPETFALISLPQEGEPIVTPFATVRDVVNISHFGNILIFNGGGKTTFYTLVDGAYVLSSYPETPTISSEMMSEGKPLPNYFRPTTDVSVYSLTHAGGVATFKANSWYNFSEMGDLLNAIAYHNESTSTSPQAHANPTFELMWWTSNADSQSSLIPITPPEEVSVSDQAWHGEIALFAAYRMPNGSIINPSPLSIIFSDNSLAGYTFNQDSFFERRPISGQSAYSTKYTAITTEVSSMSGALTIADIREGSPISYILPKLSISVDANIDTRNYTDVAVFCTRLNPVYDTTYTSAINGIQMLKKAFSDNKLPEQPFYLLDSFPLKNRESDTFTLEVWRQKLENVINNLRYEPTIQHSLSGSTSLDYNNSLHLANVNTDFRIEPIISSPCDNDGSWANVTPAIAIEIKNKTYYVVGDTLTPTAGNFSPNFQHILSYHDYRAKQYILDISGSQRSIDLIPAIGNNIAYYTKTSTDTKYATLHLVSGTHLEENITLPKYSDQLNEPNRIQVSAPNNPFSFPFENSYSFGSSNNRILAMQSAAIEMHEMKVGELPLYVFTEEGIFALVAGSNTLYSSVAAINYDKIINPNTLAINGAIVYITEKGVHLLTSQGTQVISQPIHDAQGMPPIDFLSRCKIVWPKQYNEIVLLDEESTTGKAYVYNLDAGYWSTRTLQGVKLNTDELYNDNTIYNLADENEQGVLDAEIVTRPIKLGNVEFKRLETIIPRMQMYNCEWTMQIMGAVSPEDYRLLRSVNDSMVTRLPVIIRRTPFSAKYFKVAFEKFRHDGVFAISHIDFEWYARFLHRMR